MIAGAPIAVDSFKYIHGVSHYFLTHAHSDHMNGLRPSWNLGTIYCSEITKCLVKEKFGIKEEIIHPLEVNETSVVFLDKARLVSMSVTLIDAQHCPGSVMFLFQGYFGTFLCTGDFRYDNESLWKQPLLRSVVVDHVYVDDTYFGKNYYFPPRHVVLHELMDKLRQVTADHVFDAVIIAVDTLGKEDLVVEVTKHFGVPVYVGSNRLLSFHLADKSMAEWVTHDPTVSTLSLCSRTQVSSRMKEEMRANKRVLAIFPTGWNMTGSNGDVCQVQFMGRGSCLIKCCYSLHSCHHEIVSFLRHLQPRTVHSLVNCNSRAIYEVVQPFLNPSKPAEVVIPPSLRRLFQPPKRPARASSVVSAAASMALQRSALSETSFTSSHPPAESAPTQMEGGPPRARPPKLLPANHPFAIHLEDREEQTETEEEKEESSVIFADLDSLPVHNSQGESLSTKVGLDVDQGGEKENAVGLPIKRKRIHSQDSALTDLLACISHEVKEEHGFVKKVVPCMSFSAGETFGFPLNATELSQPLEDKDDLDRSDAIPIVEFHSDTEMERDTVLQEAAYSNNPAKLVFSLRTAQPKPPKGGN